MRTPLDADGVMDPIIRLIEEVQAALKGHLYSVSLMSALALVDICGALESNNGRGSRESFKRWYRTNLPAEVTALDEEDAWALRNGMLHQAHTASKNYDFIGVLLPDLSGRFVTDSIVRPDPDGPGVLLINHEEYVTAVLVAVGRWWTFNKRRDLIAKNAEALARVRTRGRPPIGDLPILG